MGTQYSVLTASMRRYLPALAVAVAGMVALAVTPDLVVAQQAIAQARTTISNIIGLAGLICIIGGLVLMVQSGFAIKEGRGGWPALAASVVLILVGAKASVGGTSWTSIFGSF